MKAKEHVIISFSAWHLSSLAFVQLTYRESLRDIEATSQLWSACGGLPSRGDFSGGDPRLRSKGYQDGKEEATRRIFNTLRS